MAGKQRRSASARPDAVPDEVWVEAVRRAGVIAPLVETGGRLTRARVREAGRALGLSVQSTYRLLARYRENPVTAALVPASPGPAKGTRRLAPQIEAVIDRAIQLHGGAGVSDDTVLARFYASARTLRIVDGPDAVHIRGLAKEELGRERPYAG